MRKARKSSFAKGTGAPTRPSDPDTFVFGTPDNFMVTIDEIDIGVLEGTAISTGTWKFPDHEQRWLTFEIAFYSHVLERLKRYKEVRERQSN